MVAAYYLAAVLVSCKREINARWPNRDRTSDGWIGDTSHAARASDHNPDWTRTPAPVRAIDVDKDGIDPMALVAAAIAHPSTNYVIFNGFIWSRAYGFRRRVYTGPNKHEHHVHISILHTVAAETSTRPWLAPAPVAPTAGEDVALTDAEIVAIANRTAAVVWGWELSGWDKPETNKQPAWQRLTGVHETVVRQLTGDASALIETRNRIMGVLPPTLDELGDALWDAQGVDVDNAATGARELVSVRAALGLAASVIATGRSTAAFGGGLDPDVLAAAVAASIPDDLAEAVVTALRQRTLIVQIQP